MVVESHVRILHRDDAGQDNLTDIRVFSDFWRSSSNQLTSEHWPNLLEVKSTIDLNPSKLESEH